MSITPKLMYFHSIRKTNKPDFEYSSTEFPHRDTLLILECSPRVIIDGTPTLLLYSLLWSSIIILNRCLCPNKILSQIYRKNIVLEYHWNPWCSSTFILLAKEIHMVSNILQPSPPIMTPCTRMFPKSNYWWYSEYYHAPL